MHQARLDQQNDGERVRTFNQGQEIDPGDPPQRSLSDQRRYRNPNAMKRGRGFRPNPNSAFNRRPRKKVNNRIDSSHRHEDISDSESVSSLSSNQSFRVLESCDSSYLSLGAASNYSANDINMNFAQQGPQSLNLSERLRGIHLAKQNYERQLSSMTPADVILDCRGEIDDISRECIQQNMRKIEHVLSLIESNRSLSEVFQLHLVNLKLQQAQFDKYIAETKGEISSMYAENIQSILDKGYIIKSNVQAECKLFRRSYPGYSYKSDIITKLKDNDIVIIGADLTYFMNILLPIFVKNEFRNHLVYSCETSEVLCQRVQKSIEFLVGNNTNASCNVQFVTEEKMLNFFLNSNSLGNQETVTIFNLPLKRSIVSDILMALLRDELLLRNDNSKLVILTSGLEPSQKYEKYFSTDFKVATIKAPQLTFPVKTVWKNVPLSPLDDYIKSLVDTILSIHLLNEEGDIVAFLPNITDARSAMVQLRKKVSDYHIEDPIEYDLLHENSTDKPCLNLTMRRSNKRIVYFCTECAEMFPIPNVQYVIDCGLRKENMFDVSKKLDVLTTAFISTTKAKLRKNLAGTFSNGTCYRLYSKENYCKEFAPKEYAEILTVNPFNSLIKVFQYRPDSVVHVDFVDPLSERVENHAVNLLKKYNAVKDGVLTKIGKDIVKLPYPTRYSKLILTGIQWGLAYEAVVFVAFSTTKGYVFQYDADDPNLQRNADAAKLRFIQSDSDTLSYLHIYKVWLENNDSEEWCKANYINFDVLKIVHNKVKEICQTVGESLNENIIQRFSAKNTNDLMELLFECFQDQLCVYTGHCSSGYRVLSSKCIAFLHPSSIIARTENLPEFIIFDHMTSTTRDFLSTVTSIPREFIMDALTDDNHKQSIDFDYSDMFEKSLVCETIEPVGERVIKIGLLGSKREKLRVIEDNIRMILNNESVVIEPSPEKGCVRVYALESNIKQAVELVNQVIKEKFEEITNLEQKNIFFLRREPVEIPIEVKWLKGAVATFVKRVAHTNTPSNSFENENSNTTLQNATQKCINLTWMRLACTGSAFITFEALDFEKARKLAMKYIEVSGNPLTVQVSKFGQNQLHVTELPSYAKKEDLEYAIGKVLPCNAKKIELKYEEPRETSNDELIEIKKEIDFIVKKNTQLSDFELVENKINMEDNEMKVCINVRGSDDVEEAAKLLSNNLSIGGKKIFANHVYKSVINCNKDLCLALKERFKKSLNCLKEDLSKRFENGDLFSLNVTPLGENMASINLTTPLLEAINKLQRIVNNLLQGELLNKSFSKKLNKLFCHGGHIWLRTLERASKVHIIEDLNSKTLRLYGSEEGCELAKKRIMQFLKDTENESVKVVPLSKEGNNKTLLKMAIVEYGANMEKFVEVCKLQSAVLDIRSCTLTLHGSRESIENADDCLRNLASSIDSANPYDTLSDDSEICPICASPALNLTVRLELCGHLYCSECIQGLVEQAQFPIQCCVVNCREDILLDDINKVLEDDLEKLNVLLEKSMKNYLIDHQDEVYYCPAPDCTMFYYKQELQDSKFNCILCQNDICMKCNVVFHQGYTCEMFQGSRNDPDYSFTVWKKTASDCKQCPKCKTPIQRFAGCDHMTCTRCLSHFCWLCDQEFPEGVGIYAHIPFCPKQPKW